MYLINIGGNDITTTSGPEDIVERIVKLVDQLYRRRRVKMVYVAEIQTRGDFRGGLTKQEFDDKTDHQRPATRTISSILCPVYAEITLRNTVGR